MESVMARGDQSEYTGRQKRIAEHIEAGYKSRGAPGEEAGRRTRATVNKVTGAGCAKGRNRATDRSRSRSRTTSLSR